jgi:hypothetical protein
VDSKRAGSGPELAGIAEGDSPENGMGEGLLAGIMDFHSDKAPALLEAMKATPTERTQAHQLMTTRISRREGAEELDARPGGLSCQRRLPGAFEILLSNIKTSGDVDISYGAGLLEIATAPLTITANAVSRPFGQANPMLTATITGWAYGDDAPVFISPLQFDTVVAVDSGVGKYTIVPSGAVTEFYSIDFVPGVLTIVRADQSIVFPEIDEVVLDREPVTVALEATSSSGLPATFTLLEGDASLVGNTLTISVPGSLAITASQAGDASWNAAANVVRHVDVTGRGVIADMDGDGLPDAFQARYFADNTSADPNADDDHDLFSNRAEWLFGTSPIDRRSLPMVQFDAFEQSVSIETMIERRYVLEVSSDLTEFEAFGDSPLGTGDALNFAELPQGNGFQAFRIRVLEE